MPPAGRNNTSPPGATPLHARLKHAHPLGLATGILVVVGVITILLTGRVYNDDPYITFRYARNLAEGRGFVYNPGERVAGTTAPLFALVLGGLLSLGLTVRAGVTVLAAVAYGLMGACAWRLMRRLGMPWGGPVWALLLLIDPQLFTLYGHETTLAVALVLAALTFWELGRASAAMICAALLVGVRPDGALLGGVLVLMALDRGGGRERLEGDGEFRSACRRRPWPALGWAALVFLPLYGSFVIYYGTPFPNTLAVKMHQGHASDVAPFWKGTLEFFRTLVWPGGPSFTGALALLGTGLMFHRRWLGLPLFVLLYAFAFCLINPPFYYYWYQYPYWLLRAAAVAWAIGWLAEPRIGGWPAWERWGRHAMAPAAALVVAAELWIGFQAVDIQRHRRRWRAYTAAAESIQSTDASPRRIILDEIGIIGFHLEDWEVIDMEGLIHRRPLSEVIGDRPPPLAVFRGKLASRRLNLDDGRTLNYERVKTFEDGPYACTLMRHQSDGATRGGAESSREGLGGRVEDAAGGDESGD